MLRKVHLMLADRIIAWALAISLAFLPVLASAQSSPLPGFPPGVFANRAPLSPATVTGYQGPGDAVSGIVSFGSCARVATAALALPTTKLCDLVLNAAPTTVVCTLRGTTSGFVDLSLCFDGVTVPATVCVSTCNISKVYDQAGGLASGWINSTAAQQPKLTFSALNGLPGMTSTNAAATNLVSTSTLSQTAPFSLFAVYERTSTVASQWVISYGGNAVSGPSTVLANNATYRSASASVLNVAANDNAYHAAQAIQNGASTSISADGTTTTGNIANGNISAATSEVARSPSTASVDGTIMEFGLVSGAFSISAMNSNQHGSSGYNF